MRAMKDPQDVIQTAKSHLILSPRQDLVIVSGNGVMVQDMNGREYIDCNAGPGVLAIGHCHPKVVAAAKAQVESMTQTPGMCYSIHMMQLAEKLARLAPGNLVRSFFCNSGAEAIEGAVKLIKKYAYKNRNVGMGIVALEHAFHGRLSLPLTLCGSTIGKKGLSTYAIFPGVVHVPAPYCYRCPFAYPACDLRCAEALKEVIELRGPGDVCAFVCEPILGVAGVIIPPEGYLPRVMEICREHGISVIFDEVFTGFGRTGKMFACEHWDCAPDVMAVGKVLGGGLPLAAFVATDDVGSAFDPGDHYTTFGANNVLALTTGLKTIEVLEEERLIERSREVGTYLLDALFELMKKSRIVGDIRGKGLFIALEIVSDRQSKHPAPNFAESITNGLREQGVLAGTVGTYRNVIRLSPPLTIGKEEIASVLKAFRSALRVVEGGVA